MKQFLKFSSVIAIVAVASLSLAQGQGGRGQGRGGARGGGMQSEVQLVMRPDVQRDLALTSEQIGKLAEVNEKFGRGARGAGGAGAGGGGQRQGGQNGTPPTEEERKAMQEAAAKRREESRAALSAVLTPAQMSRVKEISLQLAGSAALSNGEVQKALALTPDQIEKIKSLNTKMQEASRGLMQKVRDQEITREEVQGMMAKNTEIMKAELAKVLTEKQAAEFKKMQGPAFKADE